MSLTSFLMSSLRFLFTPQLCILGCVGAPVSIHSPFPSSAGTPPGPNEFVKIPAGMAAVGKPNDFPSYGWDNEYGLAEVK